MIDSNNVSRAYWKKVGEYVSLDHNNPMDFYIWKCSHCDALRPLPSYKSPSNYCFSCDSVMDIMHDSESSENKSDEEIYLQMIPMCKCGHVFKKFSVTHENLEIEDYIYKDKALVFPPHISIDPYMCPECGRKLLGLKHYVGKKEDKPDFYYVYNEKDSDI